MPSFSSLQIALSGLYAQQRGLDVTGQNVANANTEGYSRQRVELSPNSGPVVPAFHSRWNGSGLGVEVRDVTRAHDAFLTARSYDEHSAGAALDQAQALFVSLERLFNEPSDLGIQKLFSEFWSGWDEVGNHPDDQAARNQLLQRAQTLTGALNQAAGELDSLRGASIDQLGSIVTEINTLAAGVAGLNDRIRTAANAGIPHADLLDQRDLLVSKLSDLVGVTVRPGEDDTVDVYVAGGPLVRGTTSQELRVDTSGSTVQVEWVKDGYPVATTAGAAGGLLTAINDTLVRYGAELDAVAVALRDGVNSAHAALAGTLAVGSQDLSAAGILSFGMSVNGSAVPSVSVAGADWSGPGGAAALQAALQAAVDASAGAGVVTVAVSGGNGSPLQVSLGVPNPSDSVLVSAVPGNAGLGTLLSDVAVGLDGVGGRPFFTGTSAADLAVAGDVLSNPSAVAAAYAGNGPLDGSAATALAEAGSRPGGATARYRDLVVHLGVEAQSTYRRVTMQAAATRQVDAARDAVSGVNIDEEMVNMIQFEHAYNASARVMTAIDEMLDTLITRTGVVGR